MNYDIRIYGEDVDNGSIEFDRLNLLTKSTKDIATKALMLNLRGYSEINPDKNLKRALAIKLQSINGGPQNGTYMTLDCSEFSQTIKGVQFDIFRPTDKILNLTPMFLVIDAFKKALDSNCNDKDLDKPLLKSLYNFKKNFISNNEVFCLSNRGSIPEVRLTKDDFIKIEKLEESFPEPQKVIINGKLDEIKISKSKLGLQTSGGVVTLIAKESQILNEILEFIGKDVTISGISHYKPNGEISFVEIINFNKPNEKDFYFSRKGSSMSSNQQVLFQMKKGKVNSSLESIFGLLKDEINDEQFHEIIKSTHR